MSRRRRDGDPDDPLRKFYEWLFKTRIGQIIMAAGLGDAVRDALAAMHIVRLFPWLEYPGIKLEPSRPDIMPAEYVIIVGGMSLFLSPKAPPDHPRVTVPIGEAKLGERLARIAAECCYAFKWESPVVLVNRLTEARYEAVERDEHGRAVDYGVIRRVDRGAREFTVILEGIHALGTLGAVKVATWAPFLGEALRTVSEAPGYDPTRPVEILVRTIFDSNMSHGVYTLDAVAATPLNIVYDRTWIYDMTRERRWVNQEWPAVCLELRGKEPPAAVPPGTPPPPVPYLEVEADLRHLDDRFRELCRGLQPGGPAQQAPVGVLGEKVRERLLEELARHSDVIEITLHEEMELGGRRVYNLPTRWTPIRADRKKWLVILILCRVLGLTFPLNEERALALFPDFSRRKERTGEALVRAFISSVNGKMRSGFGPLFENLHGDKNYVQIDRSKRTYHLQLNRLRVILKLWL